MIEGNSNGNKKASMETIGAKITPEQMERYERFAVRLGITKTELVKIALDKFLIASESGDNQRLTGEIERARLQGCPLYKALGRQLFMVSGASGIQGGEK